MTSQSYTSVPTINMDERSRGTEEKVKWIARTPMKVMCDSIISVNSSELEERIEGIEYNMKWVERTPTKRHLHSRLTISLADCNSV